MIAKSTKIAELPIGYRPSKPLFFTAQKYGNPSTAHVGIIYSNGIINIGNDYDWTVGEYLINVIIPLDYEVNKN